jgi:Tfp pilus assembly protein PilW
MRNIDFKTKGGYTIIETMVSVSIFLLIVTAGMGALLNANLAHEKSEDMRSIMDNLSFVMEDMSRNLRVGSSYQCFNNSQSVGPSFLGVPRNCDHGWAIAFEEAGGDPSTYTDQWVYYVSSTGKVLKSTDGANTFVQLTPDEVVISDVNVFPLVTVVGAPGIATDEQQPFITIRLVGTITYKNAATPFSLQTSVSQRLIDI